MKNKHYVIVFNPRTTEESHRVQKLLFLNGFKWNSNDTHPLYDDIFGLFIDAENKRFSVAHRGDERKKSVFVTSSSGLTDSTLVNRLFNPIYHTCIVFSQSDADESTRVQKLLFSAGFSWACGDAVLRSLREMVLCLNKNCILWNSNLKFVLQDNNFIGTNLIHSSEITETSVFDLPHAAKKKEKRYFLLAHGDASVVWFSGKWYHTDTGNLEDSMNTEESMATSPGREISETEANYLITHGITHGKKGLEFRKPEPGDWIISCRPIGEIERIKYNPALPSEDFLKGYRWCYTKVTQAEVDAKFGKPVVVIP